MDTQTDKTPQETLAPFASKLGVSVEDILSRCRKTELVDARSMIVAILMNRPRTRQQDVALLLGISQAAVSKLFRRHRALKDFDIRYRTKWESLQNQ